MKMRVLSLFACLGCFAAFSAPVDAVLVVQNHIGNSFDQPLSSLSDRFSAALSGDLFNVVDPGDVIGNSQNVHATGEKMPDSSATRLAELCGERVLITVSLDNYSVITTGSPAMLKQRTVTATIQAKCAASGASVRGITRKCVSPKFRLSEFADNADSIYDDLVQDLVAQLSREFLAKSASVVWKAAPQLVDVAFGCNMAGAAVSVDGVAFGTAGGVGAAPLKVKVLPGVHNLRIDFPFTIPFETRANLQANSTYMVVLRENDAGRALRERDAYLGMLFDRIAKSGATDDLVREVKARGYGKYLSASCHRIEGMPQTITLSKATLPDPGLAGNAFDDAVKPTAALIQEVKSIVK